MSIKPLELAVVNYSQLFERTSDAGFQPQSRRNRPPGGGSDSRSSSPLERESRRGQRAHREGSAGVDHLSERRGNSIDSHELHESPAGGFRQADTTRRVYRKPQPQLRALRRPRLDPIKPSLLELVSRFSASGLLLLVVSLGLAGCGGKKPA